MLQHRFFARTTIAIETCALLAACSGGGHTMTPQLPAGSNNFVTQQSVVPNASGNFRILYTFPSIATGEQPYRGLVPMNGVLYGSTFYGGNNACNGQGCGTVFSLTTAGVEHVLYRFKGGTDGAQPMSTLIAINGVLYGTTFNGGGSGCFFHYGCGTVFSVNTVGQERVLYRFKGAPDGATPSSTLIAVNGTFYGTASDGGSFGQGIIFSLSSSGTERVLHSFRGGATDGALPSDNLIEVNGVLFGTTAGGGSVDCSGGCGTVFSIGTSGSERIVYKFNGFQNDGANPQGGLIELNGRLYGTTENAGRGICVAGCGTIYEVTTSGSERVLHFFTGGVDGRTPLTRLVALNGELYGTTNDGGGPADSGTIYKVSTSGTETVLYSFKNGVDGNQPNELTSLNGRLYGTTSQGGANGTVFSLIP